MSKVADSAATSESGGTGLRRGASWLMLTTALTGVANYAFALAMVWMLPSHAYSLVGIVATLLLICGTVAGASAPWVLAQEIALARGDAARRRGAVTFSMATTGLQAIAAAGVCAVIGSRSQGGWTMALVAAAVLAIFYASVAVGYLQGQERFPIIAMLRLLEVGVKLAVGIALVASGAGVLGALAGFAAGAGLVAVVGLAIIGPDLRPRFGAIWDTTLWRSARGLLGTQSGVAVLAGCDVIVGSFLLRGKESLAAYQVSLVLARIPLFVSVALSMVVFPRLAGRRTGAGATNSVRAALMIYAKIAVPLAVMFATLPRALIHLVFPATYDDITTVLPWTAAAGVAFGAINLVTTFFQAEGRFVRPVVILSLGVACQAGLLVAGTELAGTTGLAVASAIGAVVVGLALGRETSHTWRGCGTGLSGQVVLLGVIGAPLFAFRDDPWLWCAWACLAAGLPMARALASTPLTVATPSRSRLQILHLGFEDPRRPGSGGGGVRTREINRRLARRHDITVVTTRYPGCTERVEDGVRYVHAGCARFGSSLGTLSYFAALPWRIWRSRADLVVEDFAVPFSSVAVPWMTRRPVVGLVQWLFAREKWHQYHVPFHLVERVGLSSHRRLVAVSADLAATLRRRNPTAEVHTVPNGLDEDAYVSRGRKDRPRRDMLFLGRLEIAQKGLDLLVEALAVAAPRTDVRLRIAGSGPDEAAVRALVRDHGLEDRVEWLGRVPYDDRLALLASAAFVAMPSRYESFGMVAAEALAQSTPVLSFDIPCLRELVTERTGVRVPVGDVAGYADALVALANDPERCRELGQAGPDAVADLRWEELARAQEGVYLNAVARRSTVAMSKEEEIDPGSTLRATLDRIATKRHHGTRPLRLLLIGNYGAGNTGDEAILARILQVAGGRTEVTVVARDPVSVSRLHGAAAVPTVSARSLSAFWKTDVIMIGGGGMFGAGLPQLVRLLPFVTIAARLLGKDVCYEAIGAYTTTPRLVLAGLRLSGRLASAVSVRDRESYTTFTGGWLGRPTRPALVADPAIALRPAPPAQALELLAAAGVRPGLPPLCLSLKAAPDHLDSELLVDVAAAVDWWCRHRASDVVFIPFSTQGDYGLGGAHADAVLAESVRARLAEPSRFKVLPAGLHPVVVKAVIGQGAAMVGMRLHAMIFAWSMGVPVLGVSFEPKANAFLDQVQAPCLSLPEATAGAITTWLAATPFLASRREPSALAQAVPGHLQDSRQ